MLFIPNILQRCVGTDRFSAHLTFSFLASTLETLTSQT